jgi:hypothetical protein
VLSAFDYGTTCRTLLDLPRPCNQAVYGQAAPPAYDLTAIRTPLVVFTGGGAWGVGWSDRALSLSSQSVETDTSGVLWTVCCRG